MMSATFFGEITEPVSRAVWYSDEESDGDSEDDDLGKKKTTINTLGPVTHESIRNNIVLNFQCVNSNLNLNITTCIISISSSARFKSMIKSGDTGTMQLWGLLDQVGAAFLYPNNSGIQAGDGTSESTLWLLFDSGHPYITGQETAYFVEALREKLYEEFRVNSSTQIIILSQQYTDSDNLEYLGNFHDPKSNLPFTGVSLMPPSLIKSQFESALFEQLTLSLKPALMVCLPNPKNFWFDKTKSWPSVSERIIDQKLNDDSLEKTLIFS